MTSGGATCGTVPLVCSRLNALSIQLQADVEPPTPSDKKVPNVVSVNNGEWPNEGKVEFVNYSTSYRPGILPDVLRSVTFTVQPREKVSL